MTKLSTPVRRVLTANDPKGNGYFASDELLTPYDPTTAPEFSLPTEKSAFGIIQLHRTRGFPADNQRPLENNDPYRILVPLADTKGPSARVIDLPPHQEGGWMHRTLSLDYCVVLSGSVTFITDGGEEKTLKEHDVIVTRGVNHAWVNRGGTVARVFVVVVPALPIVTEDKVQLDKTPAGDIYDPEEEED
ncbi:cupin domain protein [Sporothrix schenckii 1099-18]|uniref:Cupin domain protein n=1 Tax=Sporothrix schenckii 1099-18 TaxID=1397361 RepID=A0A0F2MK49_SPOSC|nr:cupin domain protein [Sporothrix schenckii 1099-18]KJR90083.1 cupin domain protein [Sporothrix schenckii 1099-18]